MEFRIWSSPHLPVADSVSAMMRLVLLALLPGTACFFWLFGWGVLINIGIASLTALVAEAVMLLLRRRPVGTALLDGSALVAGALLALALPPLAPWWIPVIGSLFAIVIAKQLYGGLGYNPFNPAMAGYVVLLISFPLEMTLWPPAGDRPDVATTLALIFTGSLPGGVSIDAVTMATPMDAVRTRLGLGETISGMQDGSLFGLLGGAGWEWINLGFLAGGLLLLKLRVIQWRIPVSMLAGLALTALLFHLIDPETYASPQFHLFSGAAMLGAFFIATDPVSASTTPLGRLCFGFGIGVLTWVIRTWGGYPDGVAFAVLLMNLAAPTIDFYTRPKIFGEQDR
ncbi:MAG: electron transport complex subunit RsxD [Thiohalobacterales bacterium]|nr:electron transport complex subunit RsxD [Thiohalobacterales bacterium]